MVGRKNGFLGLKLVLGFILFTFVDAKRQNLSQILLRPLMKFGSKVLKIF
jgi:hypothetical protein